MMKLTGSDVVALLRHALKVGTIENAIDIAEEWINSAEGEIHRLKTHEEKKPIETKGTVPIGE